MHSHKRLRQLNVARVRRERIRPEIRESFGRGRHTRRHPRTGSTTVSAEPLPLELAHFEELHTGQDDALRRQSVTSGSCRIRIRIAMAEATATTTPKKQGTSRVL